MVNSIISEKDYYETRKQVERTIRVNRITNSFIQRKRPIKMKDLIKIHTSLVGKRLDREFYNIDDCALDFIEELLSANKRTVVCEFTDETKKFINSKYLSDYCKSRIKEFIHDEYYSLSSEKLLDSEKTFNEMTTEEIKTISIELLNKSSKINYDRFITKLFMPYIFNLEGTNVSEFIRENVTKPYIGKYVLETSGLPGESTYYSGRGVNFEDLNDENLVTIFDKLCKIDKNYALEYVEMVKGMETLGATEFIDAFNNFANNDFKNSDDKKATSNVHIYEEDGAINEASAFASIFSAYSRGEDRYDQISESNDMKDLFIASIEDKIKTINPDFSYKPYNDDIRITKVKHMRFYY